MMIGLILLVIIAFYMFDSGNAARAVITNYQSQARNSLAILNDRYARGEISRDDYLERKQVLTKQ